MKAVIAPTYGPPEILQFVDLPKPVPKDGEVLIRVRATTVSSGDWRVRSLQLPGGFGPLGRLALGFRGPRQPILGTELSGEVEAIGRSVTAFKVGDHVVAFPGAAQGCHAEYRCVAAPGPIALKPPNLSFEQAASLCFGGATMLDFYRRAALHAGDHVLVNGASGTVGTAAVQLAKHVGARVTAVCGTANVERIRTLGADHVIDYTQEDFTQGGETYTAIVDVVGTAPFSRCGPSLSPGGRLLVVLGTLLDLLRAPWISLTSGKKVIAGPTAERPEYVQQLADLASAGHFIPVVDRCYPFEQIVEAHRYVDAGHKRGSVVIQLHSHSG